MELDDIYDLQSAAVTINFIAHDDGDNISNKANLHEGPTRKYM